MRPFRTDLPAVAFLALLVAWSAVEAQPAGALRRVGILGDKASDPSEIRLWQVFREALGAHGWSEGPNVRLEYRWVEGNDARRYISAADSSMSTWIDYAAPAASRISYYSQGRNIAQLLDLSIRHDTSGARGLDEVMRALFTDFYQRGRGFSTEDLIRVVNRISGKPSVSGGFSKAFCSQIMAELSHPVWLQRCRCALIDHHWRWRLTL